jgi:hypothetical protein
VGWTRGGSPYNAYYQLWRFLVGLLVGLLLLSVIRKSRDLKALGLAVLLAALVRGTLCIYFYWGVVHGKIEPPPPYMTTHDDSLLFVAGVLVSVSWALARGTLMVWLAAALVTAHLLYAIVLNDRRLAWVELLLVVILMFLLPRGRVRRRMTRFLLFAAPVLALYTVVGWGREGAVFAPLQALSSTSGNGTTRRWPARRRSGISSTRCGSRGTRYSERAGACRTRRSRASMPTSGRSGGSTPTCPTTRSSRWPFSAAWWASPASGSWFRWRRSSPCAAIGAERGRSSMRAPWRPSASCPPTPPSATATSASSP